MGKVDDSNNRGEWEAMKQERENWCNTCENSERITYNDFHEVCMAGICALCFQSGYIDCDRYKKKENG